MITYSFPYIYHLTYKVIDSTFKWMTSFSHGKYFLNATRHEDSGFKHMLTIITVSSFASRKWHDEQILLYKYLKGVPLSENRQSIIASVNWIWLVIKQVVIGRYFSISCDIKPDIRKSEHPFMSKPLIRSLIKLYSHCLID